MANIPREDIPDDDDVSRWVFEPSMLDDLGDLLWLEVFPLSSKAGKGVSLVWRKYAISEDDVHNLGCADQRRRRNLGKNHVYRGCITACVGEVRRYRNQNNHGFVVVHEPDEGIHHAEIAFDPCPDKNMTRNDRTELKYALRRIFSPLAEHSCPVDG